MCSTFNHNNQILHTISKANYNNNTERVSKISPIRANFISIENNSNLNKNLNENTINNIHHVSRKPTTPLLADMKRYQDRISKKSSSNFEYRKIKNNNNKMPKKAVKTENISGGINNRIYFENNSSFNKLIGIDKLNYSNNLNKTNKNETAKNLSSRNNSLLQYGFNFTNTALNSSLNNQNDKEKMGKNDNIKLTQQKKRPASSNYKKIIKVNNNIVKEVVMLDNNNKKLNHNMSNPKNNNNSSICKDNPNNKITHYRYRSEGNILNLNNIVIGKEIKNSFFKGNVEMVIKCLKFLKFPKNYIDYYKIVLDKLQFSKNTKFLICILEDKKHLVILIFI